MFRLVRVITPISLLDKREQKCELKNEKIHKLELFYTIMCAIDEETIMTGAARPTRIQHHSRLSYDRMINHFTELEEKRMVQRTTGSVVSITVKGREFVSQYDLLMRLIESADLYVFGILAMNSYYSRIDIRSYLTDCL